MSAQVSAAPTTVTEATPRGGAGAGVDDVRAPVRGAGGGDRAGAHRHDGDEPARVVRVLDADPPGAVGRVGLVADDVAARGEAEVGVGRSRRGRAARARRPSP